MATEEEAQEAADGKEVQAEAVDLEPFHMQTHLDSKLSSMETKNVGDIIDSTEGTLKIPEDQILVEAPSEIKLPLEHNLNGTSSSLNGHMDEDNKISNEQLHEDSKKDHEQVEAALDGESTDQKNKINKEANDCLNHGETTTEDSGLLKHKKENEPKVDDQQDEDPMPVTSKIDSDIDQSQLVVDQLEHNMDLEKATVDTQPACMANISNAEVVTEARAGVQSPLDANLDDSDATLDTVDGSTEKEEAAREEGAIHLEHRESFPEDISTAKHTEEVVKAEDQQGKQADTTDADAMQEDVPKCEETGVPEEIPKSEHADESIIDAQQEFHQEPSEDINDPAYGKKEQTSQQSSMAASDDTSEHDSTNCKPPVDTQVQNKESLEEMKDAEAVDTEAAMQQSCVAFEEAIPEYHIPTTEQDLVETNSNQSDEIHNVKTVPSSEEDKVENIERGPTSGSQEVDTVGSTEEIMDNIAENIVEDTNVATVDEANNEKNMLRAEDIAENHVWGIESEVTKSTESVEIEEDSDQRHVSLLGDSAQEDRTSVSEKQQMESALEINEIEATRTEAVPKESNASVSEKPSPEDYVTESETTCGAKEVNITESLEAIEGDKDTKNREISDQNNMDSAGKSTQESNAPESEPTSEIQPEQEPESEEMKGTELAQVNESSPEINATVFHKQTQENNPTTSELHVMESGGMSNIEATEVQAAPHQLNGDHPEEKATEETITSSEPQTLEPESVEKMNDIEATKPQKVSQQSIVSPSEESVPEEIAKEDIVTIEPDDGHQKPQDPELEELDEIKTDKSQEIASSSSVYNYEEPTSEDNVTVTEPNPETQAENLRSAEVMEDTENVKGHGALAGEAAQEENVETEAIVDISPVQEPELEEAKNTEPVGTEDNIIPSDLPAERMEKETVEIEATPYESPVASIREVTENDILTAIAPRADLQPVLKQESVEDKCTETPAKPRETQQIVGSASDELIPTEDNTAMAELACETPLQNVIAQAIKDSEDAQTDQFSNLDSFLTPGEAAQESKLARIEPTSDVQEVQELGSTAETRGIEGVENEDHQQHRVSTLEEPAVDNKPNVDDHHQVHDEIPAELKDNEAMEAEQVLEQSNSSTPDNAPEERSEPANDPDCCVRPAQQVESSRDSEDNNLLKEEETSDQKIITLEDTATEDIVADEIDPPVGMEQEHEQKSVEEVKDISANEAEEDFHTNQPDSLDKLATEINIATTEPTYDIQRLNDFERKEMKSIEGITDGDVYCEQTEVATSVDASPTENEIAPQEHPVEPHEENLGNETENAVLAHGIKDEIQTSVEQKDDAFDLGEDVIQSSGEDPLESSNSTDQIKEEQKAGIEHDSSQKSSERHGENITHVQDINGEPVTERGTAESQALIENEAKASQDVTEKDDTIKSGEQTNDHRQSGDVEHRPQTCESSVENEVVQEVILDERHKEDEEVESQKEQLQADEQKHRDESDDVSNEPLVESKNIENGTTNRTEETDILEAGQTEAVVNEILKIERALHTSEDSTPSNTDTTVKDITGTDKGVEEENRPNSANTSDADAKMDNQEDQENTGKNNIVPMDSNNETTDEITNEEVEDEKLESTEDNDVERKATQQKVDASNVDINNDDQLSISKSLTKHETESADDVLQLETEGNAFDKADESVSSEKTEACNKSVPETVTFNEEICDKVTGAEGGLSNESLKTIDDTRRNLDASSVVAASNEDGMDEEMEEHELDVPAHRTMDENTPKQEMSLSEKPLPTEPEEQEDDQIRKEQDEEGMHEPDFTDDQKEIEQDLPVVETSEQNHVQHDLSIHHKVEDEKMESTEDNADTSNVDTNNDDQLYIRNSLTNHENESANDVLQLETEGNAFYKADETVSSEKTEASNTSVPETVTVDAQIYDKVIGAEGGLSDESLKTIDDTRRNLDASEVVAASNEESMNEEMEEHKLAVPAHPTMDENNPEQEISLSEKSLPTEPDEQEDDQIRKERDEEDMHEPDFGDDEKEIEQDLPVVETSEHNNVDHDLCIHHKVADEKLKSTEDNAVKLEDTQQKVDASNVDTNNDDQLSISNSLSKHETESADDGLQLETEGDAFDKADETVSSKKTEACNTSVPERVTFNEEICDKVTGAEGGQSDESLKTLDDIRRNLDASSVVTASNEETMTEEMEEHKLAVPAHPTMDENNPEQEMSLSEKSLPTEPEEQEDDQIRKEQDEEDMHEPDFNDDQKEIEQDLPVSNFLMNLILGKENNDVNEHSEPEAETKQEETKDDNSWLIISKQEESLVLPPTENNVEDKLAAEQEKKDVKCSEEAREVVEEKSHDLKLGAETSLEPDAELNKNSQHLELPPYQDKMEDKISNEILSEEAAEVFTKMEAKDIAIPNIKQDDREVDTISQKNTEAATQNENGSLKKNLDENNTKTSEEDTLGEGQTGLLPECLNDARSVNSVSEQTLLLTESGMTDAKSLPSEADSVQNPVCDIHDKTIESSSIGATSIPEIQVEREEDKTEEKQPATTATGEVAEERVDFSNDNPQKSVGPEATSDEQEPQIAEQVSDTKIALCHEKEVSEGSSSRFMDKKEDSNVLVKEGNNIQTAAEIQADGSSMQTNQDQQEAADNKTEMESEKLEESNIQEQQGNDTEQKSPKECHEEDQQFLVKKEIVVKEEDVHETVKSHTETVKIKSSDDQELTDSKVQERDLNVFSPKEVPEPKESFGDIAKPEFSTDEKQSPKADESNMSEQKTYEGKIKNEEKIQNFTDEAMKTEAQVAGQKAAHRKKQNLLSGVGSKVKHQLAKVKKVITGKPGHTKPESPKS